MSKTSIVIVTYNGSQWIENCLNSVPELKNVVIVDNGSIDNTLDIINNKFPDVSIIVNKQNLGFGAANNIGISYALNNGANYVFLLNQDAYLHTGTIEQLVEIHQLNLEYGILSPIHLNGKGEALDFNFSNYLATNKELLYHALKNKISKDIYEIPFVNAAAWLLPKSTLETVGGFDPIFFHYGEDDNYCQRCNYHKIKIGVVPNIYINHDREDRLHGTSMVNGSNLKYVEQNFKFRWTNINVDVANEIEKYIKDKRKLVLKLFIKCQFKKYFKHKNELFFITKLIKEITESRIINITKGSHYLK